MLKAVTCLLCLINCIGVPGLCGIMCGLRLASQSGPSAKISPVIIIRADIKHTHWHQSRRYISNELRSSRTLHEVSSHPTGWILLNFEIEWQKHGIVSMKTDTVSNDLISIDTWHAGVTFASVRDMWQMPCLLRDWHKSQPLPAPAQPSLTKARAASARPHWALRTRHQQQYSDPITQYWPSLQWNVLPDYFSLKQQAHQPWFHSFMKKCIFTREVLSEILNTVDSPVKATSLWEYSVTGLQHILPIIFQIVQSAVRS